MPEREPSPQGEQKHHPFEIRRVEETQEHLTLQIKHETGQEIVIFTYTPPLNTNVSYKLLENDAGATPSTSVPSTAEMTPTKEDKEKDTPVILHGRIGTDIENRRSPTGGIMAVFSLGEHPLLDGDCFWNTLAEDQRPALINKTAWWRVAAFDERVQLLDSAKKGSEYSVTAYRRTWKEATGTQGKEKTVEGFYLLDIEPVTNKTKKGQTAQQKKLLE